MGDQFRLQASVALDAFTEPAMIQCKIRILRELYKVSEKGRGKVHLVFHSVLFSIIQQDLKDRPEAYLLQFNRLFRSHFAHPVLNGIRPDFS